jgi:hypothetical protein
MSVLDWVIVGLYVALMLGIGYYVYRTKIKSGIPRWASLSVPPACSPTPWWARP